jgi:hypothetical protein
MLIAKSRVALTTIAASAAIAVAGIVPAASQAQYHNYCTGGTCYTHSNYNLGGGAHACGPSDIEGTSPKSGLNDVFDTTGEAKAAAAEQTQISAFEGVCY